MICKASKTGCKLAGHANGGVPFVEIRGTERDLEAVLKIAGDAARFAEPDIQIHMIPDIEADPEAATWGLNRVGADQRASEGSGTTVFVLDTGVRVSHQEFGGRATPALDMSVGDPLECNGDLTCAGDVQGHGTHCAGTAAGETFGVAPSAAVGSIKVLGDNGSGQFAWSYYALDWLAVNPTRPAVASMSLGGSGTQQAMREALDAAVNAGVTVVVAAGNSNGNACSFSPAFVPNAITVGSTTSTQSRSSFSNYGSCVDIWAPGSSILSAGITSDSSTSTKSGTSMACPHVSGGAALVLQVNPSFNYAQVLQALQDNAEDGAISSLMPDDTNKFLYVGEATPPPAPTPPPPPGSWQISGSGCEQVGDCINSKNYPGYYPNRESCAVQLFGEVNFVVDGDFATEFDYDVLTVSGVDYHGEPPANLASLNGVHTGVITWSPDTSVNNKGWRLCKTDGAPGPAPSPPSPTPPSPTPTPPAPTPSPPAPTPTPAPPAPTPSTGNCNSWCEPPADCTSYPYSCSGCCGGSPTPPSPPAPSPPSGGNCNAVCDRPP